MKLFLLILALAGLTDASYLTYEHYSNSLPPCTTGFSFVDCGAVLQSEYALLFGLPLALWGVLQYTLLSLLLLSTIFFPRRLLKSLLILQTTAGFVFSLYFVYLQIIVIKALCFYCMISALISTFVFIGVQIHFARDRRQALLQLIELPYKFILKPILFRFDPEAIHNLMTSFGEKIATVPLINRLPKLIISSPTPELAQKFHGLHFPAPIGLSAGFDYEAKLTQSLAPWGFGFQTVGTITNQAYEGNPTPRLARLPKSKSLLVNKGFKNPGADEIVTKLSSIKFPIPVGISLGRTNTTKLKTQEASVADIIEAFRKFEQSSVRHAYYELNISCPNLFGDVEFYSPKHLKELLTALDKLRLKRPVFVKMPIDKNLDETRSMLDIIKTHRIQGVIFGNLQKDRTHPAFDKQEIENVKHLKGHFSGRPTYDQSNELIRFAYKHYGKQLLIIGCGGVFSAQDAYEKIRAGASLIQLITGMIYQGPQIIMQINLDLIELIQKDGYTSLSQAIGADVKKN